MKQRPARRPATSRLLALLLLAAAPSAALRAAAPLPVDVNGFFTRNSGASEYYGYGPDTYDPTAPISLFVWMHGCGGDAYGDMFAIAPNATRANQSYVAISIGGRDGACWDVNADAPKVLAAIRDVSRYFNVNPRKVYLGGYSSGGDLTYRVGFENAELFAGLLVENSDPFRDTGSTGSALMAAAAWKIHVAHLAHTEDDTYPIATVRADLATLAANGFPVVRIEKPGHHYDADAAASGTNYDLRTFLLPSLDAGWVSPATFPPTLASGETKITTRKAKITLRGTAKFATRIEFKAGPGKFKKASGPTADWKVKVHLKPGRNVILVRAVGLAGRSPALKFIIRRKS